MKAVYDLAHSPPTYDFATFLVAAEIERLRRAEDHIDVIFAPGPNEGHRPAKSWPPSTEERELMMERLVIPMTGLLPSVRSVTRWVDGRGELAGEWGYDKQQYGVPKWLEVLRHASGRPLTAGFAERDRNLLTITLREAVHWPERNSDVPQWLEAARVLSDRGWQVVFVRDTRLAGEAIDGFETAPDASLYLMDRATLYSKARLNLFVNSGPMAFAIYLNAPLLNFRPICNSHKASSRAYIRECGFEPGSQPPNSPPWQRYVWERDRAGAIIGAVEQHMKEMPE